jgi:hydrogenase maturation protease
MKRIVIAGIGNGLLSDYGLGPYVIAQLQASYAFGAEVILVDAGVPAPGFAIDFANADLLLVIDGIRNASSGGTLLRYSREDILRHAVPARVDAYSPALGQALRLGELADTSPKEVCLFGIAVENTEPGNRLSESVRSAVPILMELISAEIRSHGVCAVRLLSPRATRIWEETIPEETPAPRTLASGGRS